MCGTRSIAQYMAKFVTIVVRKIILQPCAYNANMLVRETIILHLMYMLFLSQLVIFSVLIFVHNATCMFTQFQNFSISCISFLPKFILSDRTIATQIAFGASCVLCVPLLCTMCYQKSMPLLEQKFNHLSSLLPSTAELACL